MTAERDALAVQIEKFGGLAKTMDDAQMRLYNNLMAFDKREPRLSASLRQYGIWQDLSAFFKALGDMTSEISPLFQMIDAATKPKTD